MLCGWLKVATVDSSTSLLNLRDWVKGWWLEGLGKGRVVNSPHERRLSGSLNHHCQGISVSQLSPLVVNRPGPFEREKWSQDTRLRENKAPKETKWSCRTSLARILSGREYMIYTRAHWNLLHTWIILVIAKHRLVQMGRIDRTTEFSSEILAAITSYPGEYSWLHGGVRGPCPPPIWGVLWPNLHHIRAWSWLREASWLSMKGSHSTVWFRMRSERWVPRGTWILSHRMYSLIKLRDSTPPQKWSTNCYLFLVKIFSWRFCGKVDLLKLIDKYIVSGKISEDLVPRKSAHR